MSSGESVRKFYESARLELIHRIRLRDNILLFYLGAIATLLGVAFGSKPIQLEVLFVIPFISLSVSILISHHHSIIGLLGFYCVEEVEPFLKKLKPPENAPQWDNSRALLSIANESMLSRVWAHLIIIVVPTIISLVLNYTHALHSAFPFGPLWWFCLLALLVSIWVIMRSNTTRKEKYDRIRQYSG